MSNKVRNFLFCHTEFHLLSRGIVCLFVYGFTSHSRIFHSFGDVTITEKGCKFFTYARHSWPLRSECSLAGHIYCYTGLLFIMIVSEVTWLTHLFLSVCQWSCHYLFLRLMSFASGIRTHKLPLAGRMI